MSLKDRAVLRASNNPSHRRVRHSLAIGPAVLLLAVVSPPHVAIGASQAPRVPLPSPVPTWPAASGATDRGPAGAGLDLHIRVYLAGRARSREVGFVTGVSDPATASYGRYLSPRRFQAEFGPSRTQVVTVERWARSYGLKVTTATSHYVGLTGRAPAVSLALKTSIHSYTASSGLDGYAPVRGISVPARLSGDVSTVLGLDSYSFPNSEATMNRARSEPSAPIPVRSGAPCSTWWGQHRSAIPSAEGQKSAPTAICGYTPQQLQTAYGVGTRSGRGATIAIVLDGHLSSMDSDANRFFSSHHLPGFSKGQFVENFGPGFAASCGSGFADLPEEPLDVETAHIVAPQAKVVYVAADCANTTTLQQEDFLDAQTRIVDHHLGDVETNSFSTAESAWNPAMAAAWTQIFQQGAAEGIGFNFDSGDGGDDNGAGVRGGTAVQFPASDPWATAVGGTTMEIGRRGTIVRDLGWGDTGATLNTSHTGYLQTPPGDFYQGSTGGRSILFAQPAYQRNVVPGSLATDNGTKRAGREVPDLAADASPMTGWLIGYGGKTFVQTLEGGTSGAAPIVAALEADAKSTRGRAVGFANPLLYDLRHSPGVQDVLPAKSPALTLAPSCYNDATAPLQSCLVTLGLDSSLRERAGYDDVTGIGAPTSRIIAVLAK